MDEPNLPQGEVMVGDVRHERTDASLRGVVIFGGVLLILAVIIHVVLWWMYVSWSAQQTTIKRQRYGAPTALAGQKPAAPQLEGLEPLSQLRTWRSGPEKQLQQYRWVDQRAGIARIPIEEAMKIVAIRAGKEAASVGAARGEGAGSGESRQAREAKR